MLDFYPGLPHIYIYMRSLYFGHHTHIVVHTTLYMYTWCSVNHISLNRKAGLCIVMHSHPLCRACVSTRPHQLHWGDWEIGTATSCIEYNQVAGLVHTRDRNSSNVLSFCAAVLWKLIQANRKCHVLSMRIRRTCETVLYTSGSRGLQEWIWSCTYTHVQVCVMFNGVIMRKCYLEHDLHVLQNTAFRYSGLGSLLICMPSQYSTHQSTSQQWLYM